MSQVTFYTASAVGLLIGGALLYFGQHIRLGIVVPSLAVAAIIIIGIGVWRKKFMLKQ
jgi:hypothetical protein